MCQSPKSILCGQRQPCPHTQTASGFPSLGAEFFRDAASHGEEERVQEQPPALLHLMGTKASSSNPLGCIHGYFSPAEQPGASSDLVAQQSHPEPEARSQGVLVKQWRCHSQGELCLLCATCATSPVPAQPRQPGQGMLGCSVPGFLHTPHPTHQCPATPAHAGNVLFGSSLLSGGSALLPCEVP